jgi:uncharacterized protein (TIGR02646 family)
VTFLIYTDRNRKNELGQPIRPSDNWYRKAKDSTKRIIEDRNQNKDLKFDTSIYGDPVNVRPVLEELFHGKCAYCEVKPIRNDWDVEHFRPKGRVNEEPKHPGYYWLVYEWNNLYMGCQYCNQARKDSPKSKALGKKDQFPLESGSPRADAPAFDLNLEKRLLIDPCQENPEDYITFTTLGKPVAIDGNPKAIKTIEVFHLNMAKVNRARQKIIEFYLFVYGELLRAAEASSKYPDVPTFKEAINSFSKKLAEMVSDEAEFAAVSRSIKKRPTAYGIPPVQIELFNSVTGG